MIRRDDTHKKLNIRKDLSGRSRNFKMLAEIFCLTVILVLITMIITVATLDGKITFDLALILFLVPLPFAIIALILFYLSHFYKDRIFEWEFDKSLGTINYQRVSPKLKIVRTFDLYDLAAVIYSKKYAFNQLYEWDYYVALLFKNMKKVMLYSESQLGDWFPKSDSRSAEEKIIAFGNQLAGFLNLPFVYRRNFKQRIIVIFGILVVPLITSIFLMVVVLWSGILCFLVFLGLILFYAMGISKEYRRYKKNFEPI